MSQNTQSNYNGVNDSNKFNSLALPLFLAPYKISILSYTASMISTTIGFPLDSIKTRMQTHEYRGAIHCLTHTLKEEGIRGLFRGIGAPLLSTSLSRSLSVSIYSDMKPIIDNLISPIFQNSDRLLLNFPISFIAGGIAGGIVSIFACPFELTKIFQQIIIVVNKENHFSLKMNELPKNILQVSKSITKYEGITGLYSGFQWHIIRDATISALFYPMYEMIKIGLQYSITGQKVDFKSEKFNTFGKGISLINGAEPSKLQKTLLAISIPIAGLISSLFTCVIAYPIDTIKSQYQRDVVTNIIRVQCGLEKLPISSGQWKIPTREIYRGLAPSMIRGATTNVIFFSGLEWLMGHIA